MPPVDEVKALVLDNLKRIRKGLGIRSHDLDARVTAKFRDLLGASGDDVDTMSQKLTRYLEELLARLPKELQDAARHGLNLMEFPFDASLTERMDALAQRLHCEARTARRRMDRAFEQMADNAVLGTDAMSGVGFGGNGWYVESFDVVLRLDRDTPIAYERQRIFVTAPSLEEIVTSLDVPRPAGYGPDQVRLQTDVWFGGLLVGKRKDSTTNFRTAIRLPKRLRKNDRHTLGLIHRIPQGQPMTPRYVCVPYRNCRYFNLVVRFDPDRPPVQVWKHDGAPHSVVVDGEPAGPRLKPDRAFEVREEFSDLIGGLSYGIQWKF